jgi:predicted small lipoprotein YifL
MSRRTSLVAALIVALAGCGEKVPESAAAGKAGGQPKQVVDKAAADVARSLQQGAERRQEAEKKE